MSKVMPTFLTVALLAVFARPASAATDQAHDPQPPAPTHTQPTYLELDASILLVPPSFADDLELDPSPIEALLESDATLVAMPELTGQLLADAAAMHPRGRLLRAPATVAREGQTTALLISAEPAFVAMPAEAEAPADPQVSCLLRARVEGGRVHIAGLVLGGIDLALAEGGAAGAEAAAVPSVRFHTRVPDGDVVMLVLPFDLSEAFAPADAPADMVALLLVRASVIRDGVVAAPVNDDPAAT